MDTGAEILAAADQFNLDGNWPEAEKRYDQLLTQNCDHPSLLATIGTMYLRSERIGLAIVLLTKAIGLQPQSDYMSNLAIAYKYSGQYDKAMHWFGEAVKTNPTAETYSTYSAMFINVGTPERALKESGKALKLDPKHAMAHWNRAQALLELGNWAEAWDEHEWGFEAGIRVRRTMGVPDWDGTSPGRLVVYGEQGIGDEIMFASMLPELMKTNDIIFECHPKLKRLFHKAWPELTIYNTRDLPESPWHAEEKFDYVVSIGSLGRWFRRTRESFPGHAYLKADPLPKTKFRVGISWTGGLKQGRIRTRAVPLAWWQSILNVGDVEFVSLQYTENDSDITAMNAQGYDIQLRPEAKAEDYYETAQLVKSCDLVISVCTSVVHLAGALGVPCWVMTPNKPAWRYGVKGPMPWYRSVRLYRQPPGDNWIPVVQKIGYDLSELVRSKDAVCV